MLVDRAINGIESLSKVNYGKYLKFLFLPRVITVYNKKFSLNKNQFQDSINENKLNVIQNLKSIFQSFMIDITPYISFLYNRFPIAQYSTQAIKFINNTIISLKNEVKENTIDKWIILYVIDDKYFVSKVNEKFLYGYTFIKNIMLNNKAQNALGTEIDNIFIYGKNKVIKIYDKTIESDFSRVRSIISSLIPNIKIEDNNSTESIKNNIDNSEAQEKPQRNVNNNQTDNEKVEETSSKEELPRAPTPEELQKIKENEELIDIKAKEYSNNSLDQLFDIAKQSHQLNASIDNITSQAVSKAIITKIDDSQFNDNKQIPIYSDEDSSVAQEIINKDNEKMFPFLNNTKKKNSNLSDNTQANIKLDKEGKVVSMLTKLVPKLTNTKIQEKNVYNILYNKLLRDPNLMNKTLDSFEKGDLKQLLAYINNDHLPYNNKIYPKKEEVDRQVIQNLDNWSMDNGYYDAVSSDPVLNTDVITSVVNSNMHRVFAQKQLTWNSMPKEIESYIKKLLEDNNFQLIDVSMSDQKPPITQIEPTYDSEIKIRIRNKITKAAQTLTFKVPTLFEGKYHVSGGIKWLFPNVVATLPIFVVRPGKVQFRSSYSAVSFQHRTSSKADTVTVFALGINMPLLIWLLQFKSFDQISKDLGISYKIYDDKREAKNNQFAIKLPVENKYLGININNSSNAKVAKGIIVDLQTLCNKLQRYNEPFDLYSHDEHSEYIQLYTTKKKNLEYVFMQLKRYLIDKRTEEILQARGINSDIYDVTLKCANVCINDIEEERLSINNTNIRLMDLIPSEIEKALHYAISEYKRRRLINPDVKLMVNSGWVKNELRKQSVLLPYQDGNLTIENSQVTGVRIVGPGGFGTVDMVQIADRNIVPDHFGTLDPVDTSEGNPGINLSLTTGFEYDPRHKIFSQVRTNNSFKNMFGTAISQVPFVSSDDGNRAQFGGSQGRQVVPIENSEIPLVGTGMEAYVPSYSSSKFTKRSPVDGIVSYIDDKIIIIKDQRGRAYKINIMPSELQTGAGKYNGLTHTPVVKVGDKVKKNQHLVKNQFIKPSYSAGANVLACYKPESGYTYDDGIVISESFAKKYTSLHYQNIDIRLNHISELIEFPLYKLKRDGNMSYNQNDVIVIIKKAGFGGFSEDQILAPARCNVVDIQIFPADDSFDGLIKEVENTLYSKSNNVLRANGLEPLMSSKELIANKGKYEFRKAKLDQTLIRIKLIEYRPVGLGDKLTNRHGAKGVVAQIMPDDQMPVLPDGRRIDVCLNPLGVISRMNIGQLIEMHVGNILDTAKHWLEKNRNNTDSCIRMLNQLFTLLDGFEDKRLSIKMNSYLNTLPKMEQNKIINYYIDNGIRMIFPAFETPKMKDIYEAAKLVGAELETKLYLPKYGRKTLNNVTYGYLYMLKLQHISSMKQNVRTIGKYMSTTMMPSKEGHHRNSIRIGEQDSWSYLAYPHGIEVLKEMFLVNGDNPRIKEDIIRKIETTGAGNYSETDYNNLMISGSRNAFKTFATVAGLKI